MHQVFVKFCCIKLYQAVSNPISRSIQFVEFEFTLQIYEYTFMYQKRDILFKATLLNFLSSMLSIFSK